MGKRFGGYLIFSENEKYSVFSEDEKRRAILGSKTKTRELITLPAVIDYLELVNKDPNYDGNTGNHVDAFRILAKAQESPQVNQWLNQKRADSAFDPQLRDKMDGYCGGTR